MLAPRRPAVNHVYHVMATLFLIYNPAMANGDDGDHLRILIQMVQHPVIANPEAAQMMQAVPQRLAKPQRIDHQFGFD